MLSSEIPEGTNSISASDKLRNRSAKEATEDDEVLLTNEEYNEEVETEEFSFMLYPPFKQLAFLGHLFFGPKFFVHRVTGLLYLLQYAAAFYMYFKDYDGFRRSPLVWSLPATGNLILTQVSSNQ